jgi:hypothetical protein
MGELRFETTVGTLEVWIGSDGHVEVYVLDAANRATRMIGEFLGKEAHLAAIFEDLGLIDREAAWYAKEVWRIAQPTPPSNVEKLRKWTGRRVDLPIPTLFIGTPRDG